MRPALPAHFARPLSFFLAMIVVALGALSGGRAVAATTTYTGGWSGGTIHPGDTAVIADGVSITGNVIANGTLQFDRTAPLSMSGTISGTGALALTNTGTVALTGLASGTGRFDLAIRAASGQLTIGSGTNTLVVGSSGTGTLAVSGGRVQNGIGILGLTAGSVGSAIVTGGTWSNSSGVAGRILYVGQGGTGSLEVAGGFVTNANGFLGSDSTGVGTATVSSGTWNNRGSLYVGGAVGGTGGNGTLNVTGGSVTNTFGYIGSNTSARGTVTVSSGTWTNSFDLNVGTTGTGLLTITGSGGAGGVVIVGGTLSKGAGGTIRLEADGTLQIGTVTNSGGLGTSLVNDGRLVFSRTGSATVSNAISGMGSLRLTHSGTLTFSGTNSYSGATMIDAGAMLVTGALGATNVSVNAGGLLGGSGSIGGGVTVGFGGALSPGVGIESLAVGAVAFMDGSKARFEFDSSAPSAADLLVAAGSLSISGSVGLELVDLAVAAGPLPDGATLSLVSYSGVWNGGAFWYGGTPLSDGAIFSFGGRPWMIDYDAIGGGGNFAADHLADGHFLNIVAVPEPSAVAMLLGAAAAGGLFHRRAVRRGCPSPLFHARR